MKKIMLLILLIMIPVMTLALPIGDIDGDGKVKSNDYLLVKKHILNVRKLSGIQFERADIDGKNGITAIDYMEIKKIILDHNYIPKTSSNTSAITKRTVKYNDINKVVTVEKGSKLGTLPTVSKQGRKFDGWYTSAKGGTKVSSNTVVNSDITLYAHWTGYYKYVFIIGIDGLGATYKKVSSPNFDKIFGNYAYRYNAKSESSTNSAPNWASILTGVSYAKHGIHNNKAGDTTRTSKTKYPTIFYYIRQAMPKAKLVSVVNWQPINHGIVETDIKVDKIPKKDDSKSKLKDAAVTKAVIDYLESHKNNLPTLTYVHLDEVDAAAHATAGKCSTCGGFSSKYLNAAKVSDKQLGEIYNKVKKLGILDETLFIAVADHGETKTAHGGHTKEEEEVMIAVRGKTVNKMTLDKNVQNRDVAAITLYALGIDIPSYFESTVPNGLFNK